MEETIKKAALSVMTEQCYQEFFIKLNLLNVVCLKALISKGLGIAIIAGSSIVKVPQVLKIWSNHSAQGISFLSVLTDLYALTIAGSYSIVKGFPFSAYGESLFLGAQTLTIAAQVLYYNFSTIAAAAFIAMYSAISYTTTSGLVPINTLWNLQATTLPILLFGKLAQAFSNYKNKGTGQLSAVTCTMLLFGSVSRIFTSIQETGDQLIILTYMLASLGNAVIVFQFIYYRKPAPKPKKKSGKKTQ